MPEIQSPECIVTSRLRLSRVRLVKRRTSDMSVTLEKILLQVGDDGRTIKDRLALTHRYLYSYLQSSDSQVFLHVPHPLYRTSSICP